MRSATGRWLSMVEVVLAGEGTVTTSKAAKTLHWVTTLESLVVVDETIETFGLCFGEGAKNCRVGVVLEWRAFSLLQGVQHPSRCH